MRGAIGALWIAAILALVALGTWQVQRRAWKRDLIAHVDAGLKAQPAPAPATAGRDDAYRRVFAIGRFLAGKDSFVQASTVRGPGWWVLTPLWVARAPSQHYPGGRRGQVAIVDVAERNASPSSSHDWTPASAGVLASGDGDDPGTILINRGYVAERRAAPPPQTPVTITGLLRLTEPGGGFLRSNDPGADRWYSRDVAAIAKRRGLDNVAPYFIDADATGNADGQPIGGLTVVSFPNNHLGYAITWYGLALMTAAAFVYWLRRPREAAA